MKLGAEEGDVFEYRGLDFLHHSYIVSTAEIARSINFCDLDHVVA